LPVEVLPLPCVKTEVGNTIMIARDTKQLIVTIRRSEQREKRPGMGNPPFKNPLIYTDLNYESDLMQVVPEQRKKKWGEDRSTAPLPINRHGFRQAEVYVRS
jgi:hypothetical protein